MDGVPLVQFASQVGGAHHSSLLSHVLAAEDGIERPEKEETWVGGCGKTRVQCLI